ncbi:WRB/Get1 family [Dichotomocladium elegans]|nr:WRB/Get1 family [Dichotomocladium elegans]
MYFATLVLLYAFITETFFILGYSYVTKRAYQWYIHLTDDKKVAKQQKLKRDLLVLKSELAKTSSQDEFAKWAKIRRKLDKGLADVEKLSRIDSEINLNKTAFELRTKSILWVLVHGTRLIIITWYTRSAAFYLPRGWFGPAEWFLWFPMAPRGAVSVAIWMSACRQVLKQIFKLTNEFILPKRVEPEEAQ